jgi:hypothetical protein
VTGGHAAFDLRRLPAEQVVEIDTPRAAFTVDSPGYYRVDVDDQRTTFSARRGGRARALAETGEELDVGADEQLVLSDENPTFGLTPVGALDDWDRWNEERTASFGETPRSAAYVSQEVAGIDDLDRYGDWREEPRYGRVWAPRDVAPDWSPYSTGRWVYDPYYEWTWVDDAPWGWAPYHYGRWVHVSSYWGWVPGPVVVRPAYAPALVAFFGGPAVSVSVNVGLPFVSWCPLGWGEPVVPWWGGAHFVGRPYWGGWGGPRVVNNVVINNTRFVDVRRIDRYQNAMVHNAVLGLDRDRFRFGGRPVRLREARGLRPVHGDLGVRPAAHSFVPHEGRGHRPPERLRNRSVVATRAPRDLIHRLRQKGVDVASSPTPSAKTRIVRPRGGGADRLAARRQQPEARTPLGGAANERQHGIERDRGRGPRGRRSARDRTQSVGGAAAAAMAASAPRSPRRCPGVRTARDSDATPSRPSRRAQRRARRRERMEQATPRMLPGRTRGARRATRRARSRPPHRMARAAGASRRAERATRSADAARHHPRFERPQRAPGPQHPSRAAPQRDARRAPAHDVGRQRAMRNRPSPDAGRSMQRQAPRMERRAERAAPRPRNGRGNGHQREG